MTREEGVTQVCVGLSTQVPLPPSGTLSSFLKSFLLFYIWKGNEGVEECHFQHYLLGLTAEACFLSPRTPAPKRHCSSTAVFLAPQNGSLCAACPGPQGCPHMTAGRDQWRREAQKKWNLSCLQRLGQDPRDACVPPLRTACVQLAETMWTSSTASRAFHQVRQGLGREALPVHTPCPGPPCLAAGMSGQKGPGCAGGDSTEETMDVSGPAQEQETFSIQPGNPGQRWTHLANVKGRSERDGMRRPRSEGLSAENPLGTTRFPSHSEVGAGGEGAGVFPLLAEGRHLAEGLRLGPERGRG